MIALKRNHMFREESENTMRIFSQHIENARQANQDDIASNMPRPLLRKQTNLTVITCLILLTAVSYSAVEAQASETVGQPASVTNLIPSNSITSLSVSLDRPARSATAADQPSVPVGDRSSAASSSTSGSTSQSGSNFQVSVNGQDIAVPDNGSMSKSVPTADGSGQTNISITNTHSSDGNSYSHSFSSTNSNVTSSTNINVSLEHSSP
jgi:hypothetical protein